MLLSITNAGPNPTDIGFLLHKNPANLHSAELAFGHAHVFYSTPHENSCTAHLLLDINSVELVRGAQQLDDYVNDRPYVASSYFAVAIGRVFGTALAGNCQRRPDLIAAPLKLTIVIEVIRARGGADLLQRLFAPLGYTVDAAPIPLDPVFPEWGDSRYFRVTLAATATVHDALSHLYVLLPVLDDEKHYYIADDEVEKLLRHGEGWLASHPERQLIVKRYLKRRPSLVEIATARLLEECPQPLDAEEPPAAATEKELERPLTLHTQRLSMVATRMRELNVKSVIDLGCGEGRLLRRLLADRSFDRILGMDVSHRALEIAARKLKLDRMPQRQRARLELFQGSLLYRDTRLNGADAAALVEVIEHLDPPRLSAAERVVFKFARPRYVLVTTPNREYNVLFPTLPPGNMRHGDHRFEWTRAEFQSWAQATAQRYGYTVTTEPVGPLDETHGAPSQLAVFALDNQVAA